MLVTRKNLGGVLSQLTTGTYAIDTETTGLRAYHGDRLFSLIISNGTTSWYFNFQEYPGLEQDWVLPKVDTFAALVPFFADCGSIFYLQNAKFDMAMLAKEGIQVLGTVYDTEVLGRLLYNRHMKYDLGSQVKAIGLEKSSEVDDYIAKHKLFTWIKSPGKEKRAKQPHFDRVPHAIISRYGEKDGEITWKLGEHQRAELAKLSSALTSSGMSGKLLELVETEAKVTRVCFDMEQTGIKIDREYCQRGFDYETHLASEAAEKFEELSGMPFLDSRLVLAKAFTAAGEKYPTTEKGNPSFTDEVLEGFTSPLAKILQAHRSASKTANTYFANFLYYADQNDRIHPNMRQAGTDTGRFSFSDPNLQNVPKDDPGEFPVRRAFVPDGPEWLLVAIDFQAMEFRLLLDYANEREIIRQIIEEDLDVHQATANKMGVSRKEAKTLNFGLLYGMGAEKLAGSLDITLSQAQKLKDQYFEALPGVRRFSQGVMEKANTRGWIFNWAGRVCYFPFMKNPRTGKMDRFAYKAANHCIQGGCADIVKIAMVRCHDHLAGKRSKMLLQIHDEILYSIHESELSIVPELQRLMATSYPARHLPMACSVEFSRKSWSDKEPFVFSQ